jgi:hypothetical protein
MCNVVHIVHVQYILYIMSDSAYYNFRNSTEQFMSSENHGSSCKMGSMLVSHMSYEDGCKPIEQNVLNVNTFYYKYCGVQFFLTICLMCVSLLHV